MTAKEDNHGPPEIVSAILEDQTQLGRLTLLGRTAPVVALAAAAAAAWSFDHSFLFLLTASGALLSFLMLGLHYVRWRLKGRRPRRQSDGSPSTVVHDSVARLEPSP